MGAFLVPFHASTIFRGLHESLYADHSTLSSLMAVTGAAVWSHLWHYPDSLPGLLDMWRSLDASCLQLVLPFVVPVALWFGLDTFLEQSESAFNAIAHIVTYERARLSNSHQDPDLIQCLQLMKKNRRDYEELLRLCDHFPRQRDLDRLKRARKKTSGSGDLVRLQGGPADFSDTTDTDWNPDVPKVLDTDSEKTCPGYSDEDDDDAVGLKEAMWRYDAAEAATPRAATPLVQFELST